VEDGPRIAGLVGLPRWHAARNAPLPRAEAGPATAIEKSKFIFSQKYMKNAASSLAALVVCRGY